jgi:hypothetical protein
VEFILKPQIRYAVLLSPRMFCSNIFFPIILTSQDLPNLSPLDADNIIRDAEKIINGQHLDTELGYMKKRKMKMNIFKKVRYALRGTNDMERLAVGMERYTDALLKMCSPNVARVSG